MGKITEQSYIDLLTLKYIHVYIILAMSTKSGVTAGSVSAASAKTNVTFFGSQSSLLHLNIRDYSDPGGKISILEEDSTESTLDINKLPMAESTRDPWVHEDTQVLSL